MPPGRIIIATGNPHKVEELRAMLALPGVEFLGLGDLPGAFAEPAETGATFLANATIKALSYAAQTGLPCLADDSGLEVDALGGAPGVISSHYSTAGVETGMDRAARDAANNARLLRELAGVEPERRSARFVCQMVLAGPPQGARSGQPGRADASGGRAFQPAAPTFDGSFQKLTGGDLPHWQVRGATYFVTFCLERGVLSDEERRLVCDACLFWHGKWLLMHLATVMPDHVHMIFRPLQQADGGWPTLPGIMKSIKGFTSREINRGRGVQGTLWESEYEDRILRSDYEIEQKLRYVAENPVRAGLVGKPGEYPFTVRGALGVEVPTVGAAGWKARPPEQGKVSESEGRGGGPECPAPEGGRLGRAGGSLPARAGALRGGSGWRGRCRGGRTGSGTTRCS